MQFHEEVVVRPDTSSQEANTGPGRRFSKGSTRGDHTLGAFGFVAHGVLFFGLGVLCSWLIGPDHSTSVMIVCACGVVGLTVLRAVQVGLTTTRESIAAIKEAWGKKSDQA